MSLIYKEAEIIEVANTVAETNLFTFDFDRYAELNGGLPLGPNQAVKITCFGTFFETSGTSTPNAYFRFRFGNLQTDEIVYFDTTLQFKACFDLVLTARNKLLYCPVYYGGDNGAEASDNRIGLVAGIFNLDVSAPLVAELSVQLSSAHVNLRTYLLGYYVEIL